jgi:hydroxymethylpyrimidine/phosphomethylpyrimidine kinase
VARTGKAYAVLGNLVTAINMLQSCPEFALLIPEVRVNLAYAPLDASTPKEVAAIEGRITVVRGLPQASGMPNWGVSDHLARRILEARKYDAEINAAINFRCEDAIIEVAKEYCSEHGLLFGWLDRSLEPEDVRKQNGASLPWKVKRLFTKYGAVPRLFYEEADWGKEPLFLALGKDAVEVASTAIELARRYRRRRQS